MAMSSTKYEMHVHAAPEDSGRRRESFIIQGRLFRGHVRDHGWSLLVVQTVICFGGPSSLFAAGPTMSCPAFNIKDFPPLHYSPP